MIERIDLDAKQRADPLGQVHRYWPRHDRSYEAVEQNSWRRRRFGLAATGRACRAASPLSSSGDARSGGGASSCGSSLAIRFNPTLLDFAGHYRYEPRPVAIARGNEKGRVERAVRYVRDGFFAGRQFADVDDLNAQANDWCCGAAADRRCPDQEIITVREAFAAEAPHLMKLPDNPYPVVEQVTVSVGKTPYVRFDKNDYSVPHSHVRRSLTVLADPDRVRIVDGQQILASHPRSYDKGERIEDPTHVRALVDQKREAHRERATDHLAHAAPASQKLLVRAAERGANLGAITAALMRLLRRYGGAELQSAIMAALDRDVPHPNAVRLALERRREDRQQVPPVDMTLPAHVRARDVAVRPHSLETYDQLKDHNHEEF